MTGGIYRRCAGAIVFNNKGLVFLGKRINLSDAWQFPQGGIDEGETVENASKRELYEETGIHNVKLIHTETTPIRYDFPNEIKKELAKKGRCFEGQDIYFSLFYFEGDEREIDFKLFEQEFDEYKWDNFDFAINKIINFKKDAYRLIAKKFEPLIFQYLKSLT